jgi:hypothetical protein
MELVTKEAKKEALAAQDQTVFGNRNTTLTPEMT